MNVMLQTYRSLLADVACKTEFSEIRGSVCELHWCLNEAPKLEKYLMNIIESHESDAAKHRACDFTKFPSELRRLVAASFIDAVSLRYLRQLLLFSYKAYVQHDNDTIKQSLQAFVSTNEEVRKFGSSFEYASPMLMRLTQRHVQSVLYRLREQDIVPFHGPGSSTTPKERWTKWFSQIENVFPYSDYYCCYYNSDHLSELGEVPVDECICAKLIAVPKDSRGPRLIAVHPSESIWIQQGVRLALERAISLDRHQTGQWPRGHIRFDDQVPNGRIALLSSKSRKYATIDLKEASDRLSNVLVERLFGRYYKYFGCCRAQKFFIAEPGFTGYDNNLHCYAPMGNATTFPVQSLVFWAICCASMQLHRFHQPGAVFVFGDDIIIPSECAKFIIDDLESFGLLVNKQKTYYRSYFRESCGVDAFKGIDVTPVRWKCSMDAELLSELQSLSDLGMRFRIAGYEEAAATVYYALRTKLWNKHGLQLFLTNNRNHGSIAEFSNVTSLVFRDAYWHQDLQKFVSPVYKLKDVQSKTVLRGWNHVLESLTSLRRSKHSNVPDRSVSRRTRLNRGWADIL